VRDSLEPFRAPWWLAGPHAQTVWGRLTRGRKLLPLRRESLETPDGDELIVDHLEGPPGSPRVVLLHGLEGSSHSSYIQGLLGEIASRGWRATVINFRSCARDLTNLSRMIPNRRPRLYHSGETEDLDFLLKTFAAREAGAPMLAIGVSLGGNVLLKWLGEHPSETSLAAAAAVSVPYDLAAGARHLERRAGRLYLEVFLKTLRRKAFDLARRFPEAAARMDLQRVRRSRTFYEFDDAATAPLHGFRDAEDYYARSSSLGFLGSIRVPALCLSAEDDPFLPAEVLPRAKAAASPSVEIVTTSSGGHVGFVGGPLPWKARFWAEELVVEWLAEKIRRAAGPRPLPLQLAMPDSR